MSQTMTSAAIFDLVHRGVQLRHLRLIAYLLETQQLSAAAEKMRISQPAASRVAKDLEEITGVTLYTRHPRGISLTDQGTRLAKRAQLMLLGLDNAGRDIQELTVGSTGVVRIGAVTGPALDMVLPTLKSIRVSRPNVDVSVVVDISGPMAQELLAHRLDFYVGRLPENADPNLFELHHVGDEPATLVVRSDHPLRRQETMELKDAVNFDWVMQMQGGLLRNIVENYLQSKKLSLPNVVLSTSSILLTLATIRESNAVAPVGRSVAEFFGAHTAGSADIWALPVASDLAVPTYSIIKLRGSVLPPAAQVFYDLLVNRFPAT